MLNRASAAPVQVDVSVYGRFQAFRLAAELSRLGVLHRLYTSYPRRIPEIPAAHVANLRWPKATEVALVRTLGRYVPAERIWTCLGEVYDTRVAWQIERTPRPAGRMLHAWASHSLKSIRAASSRGFHTFVDSACPHPAFKTALLTEEANRMGTQFNGSRDWIERVSRECALADRIVVPSEYSRRSFVEAGHPPHKLVKVPLGVDADEISLGDTPPSAWTSERPFRLLIVGTDALRKGAYDLLTAWSSLKLPHAELLVRCDVTPRARPLLRQPGVTHLPPISRRALIELYRRSTVFCFPSIDDGFGMVLLEAMAAGLPVVTTPHVGASELMEDGVHGFIVPIRNADAIAERIEQLYRCPTLVRSMRQHARRLACEYPWQRYAWSMLQAYRLASGTPAFEGSAALTA